MKRFIKFITFTTVAFALVIGSQALRVGAVALPNWNVTGSYVLAVNYLGTDYTHDMSLTEDGLGNLTGNGGNPAGGPHIYTWVLTSGTVALDAIDFYADYTASADAVTPQTVMHVVGTIAPDGTMSGTWSDNYQGGARDGIWSSTSGNAVSLLGSLSAEDFGVVNYDTGLGQLKGYTSGFGLTDATFAGVESVVVKLYAGDTLLQTNTATVNVGIDITGAQISSPFDVSGTFDYVTDGYWTNVRESEYGQSVPATKVIATVTLANGKIVTAENTTLAGDPTTIFPIVLPTTVKVTIDKYIDGVQATTVSADNASFPMSATWNATNIGAGTGAFTIGPVGFNSANPYEAVTADMTTGASYSTNEVVDGITVGANCDAGTPFALVGYSSGDTLLTATLGVATTTVPTFTNITTDKYVIVHNHSCAVVTPPETTFAKVHILKYLDGQIAIASTSQNYLFPMTATWNSANLNSGATTSGAYVLGNNHGGASELYGADTASMQTPASYTTSEITSNIDVTSKVLPVGGVCVAGSYKLLGYKSSSVSFADALSQSLATSAPEYVGLTGDRYVAVMNATCSTIPTPTGTGEISGVKFEDWDADGSDFERRWEETIKGWTIYIDANNNGTLDTGEASTTTKRRGVYSFKNLPAGTYVVREVNQTGWITIFPANGLHNITLTPGQIVKNKNFGNFHLGSVLGMKYEDKNGNGHKDRGEAGLSGWTIVLKKAGVTIATTTTDVDGKYTFTNLTIGSYKLSEIMKDGWRQTDSPDRVKVYSGTASKRNDFGNTQKPLVSRDYNHRGNDNRDD